MRWTTARLIGAWCVSHFGYRAAIIALPLLVMQQTGSAWIVGLVGGAAGVPTIAAPWWTPHLQRRLSSARWLAALMTGEGLATLVVPAASMLDLLNPGTMVGAGLAVGVLNALSGPLDASLVGAIGDTVGQDGSGAARLLAVQETALRITATVAPLVTLPMLTAFGPTLTVASEGVLSLVGAASLLGVRLVADADGAERPPGLRALLRECPQIRIGWLVRGVGCAAWFAFTLGLAVLGQDRGEGALLATVGLGCYSGGAILGSALGVLTAGAARPALVNSICWLWAGLGWIGMGLHPSVTVVAVVSTLMGVAVPPGNAATTALVTRTTRGLWRRAALTGQGTVVTGCTTFGTLVGGPLLAILGPPQAITATGAVVAAVAVLTALRRDVRRDVIVAATRRQNGCIADVSAVRRCGR